MCGIVALFRPSVSYGRSPLSARMRSRRRRRTINDFGWFLYLYTWPPFSVWALAIALAILWDTSERPAFPRWAGYMNLWLALLLVPAGLMLFFKSRPFAYDGIITFWVPTVAFFFWIGDDRVGAEGDSTERGGGRNRRGPGGRRGAGGRFRGGPSQGRRRPSPEQTDTRRMRRRDHGPALFRS